jgi:ABC-type multidrug transport system ATPase subunit/ABC-type multidrug transport system permease subunit
VQETVEFSHENACYAPGDEAGKALYDEKVNKVINLLNLDGCKGTIIGNDLIRGVSGGEKKRVTIAEAMVKNAKVLCMDEISTGLDAAVTFNIVAGLKEWSRRTDGTCIAALLQPTPEVVALFDEVILLKEGAPVYHGPMNGVGAHFKTLGFTPPSESSGLDLADWLVSMLVSPREALDAAGTKITTNIPTTTEGLVKAWRATAAHAENVKTTCTPDDISLNTEFSKNQYSLSYPRPFSVHFLSVFKRQIQVTMRNKLYMQARIFSACVISLVLGSVWFDLSPERGFEKLGMLLFCILHISFSNFAELTFSVEQKFVAFKHLDSKLFPAISYLSSWALVHLPIAIVETLIFSCVLYPMVGLNLGFNHWAFFYFQLLLANVAMASFFRIIALMSPTMEVAQTYPGPFIVIMILFAGFLISPDKMGGLKFMYWISIFSYCLRSLCQNEFLSGSYNILVPNDTVAAQTIINANPSYAGMSYADLCAQNVFPCSKMGEVIMETIGISTNTSYKWAYLANSVD